MQPTGNFNNLLISYWFELLLTEGATVAAESQIGICCGTDLEKQVCFSIEQLVLLFAEL